MTTHNDESLKPTRDELIAFLRGTGEIDGCMFGEKPATERGNFWWRKYLPILAEQPQPAPVQVDSLMVWPELPKPWHVQYDEIDGRDIPCYSPEQVRAYTERAIVAALASRAEQPCSGQSCDHCEPEHGCKPHRAEHAVTPSNKEVER